MKPGVTTNTPKQIAGMRPRTQEDTGAIAEGTRHGAPTFSMAHHRRCFTLGSPDSAGSSGWLSTSQTASFYVTNRLCEIRSSAPHSTCPPVKKRREPARTHVEQLIVESRLGRADRHRPRSAAEDDVLNREPGRSTPSSEHRSNLPAGQTAAARSDIVTVVSGLSTPIGISLDTSTGTNVLQPSSADRSTSATSTAAERRTSARRPGRAASPTSRFLLPDPPDAAGEEVLRRRPRSRPRRSSFPR